MERPKVRAREMRSLWIRGSIACVGAPRRTGAVRSCQKHQREVEKGVGKRCSSKTQKQLPRSQVVVPSASARFSIGIGRTLLRLSTISRALVVHHQVQVVVVLHQVALLVVLLLVTGENCLRFWLSTAGTRGKKVCWKQLPVEKVK